MKNKQPSLQVCVRCSSVRTNSIDGTSRIAQIWSIYFLCKWKTKEKITLTTLKTLCAASICAKCASICAYTPLVPGIPSQLQKMLVSVFLALVSKCNVGFCENIKKLLFDSQSQKRCSGGSVFWFSEEFYVLMRSGFPLFVR